MSRREQPSATTRRVQAFGWKVGKVITPTGPAYPRRVLLTYGGFSWRPSPWSPPWVSRHPYAQPSRMWLKFGELKARASWDAVISLVEYDAEQPLPFHVARARLLTSLAGRAVALGDNTVRRRARQLFKYKR